MSVVMVELIVMFTVFAAVAAVITRLTVELFADSPPPVFTARTAKYQVPAPSAATLALVALGSLTDWEYVSDVALLPYTILKPFRFVSDEPSVFFVGAVQLILAVPLPHAQVSVYDLLAV